jgi:hypothetical protein
MKLTPRLLLCAASSLFLAGALWALPASVHHNAANPVATRIQTPQTQSASGTIASFDKSSLTLNVTSPSSKAQVEALQSQNAKTMTFSIDQNTTVDGTLKVGANADVTYRTDSGGNNVAISVHVSQ